MTNKTNKTVPHLQKIADAMPGIDLDFKFDYNLCGEEEQKRIISDLQKKYPSYLSNIKNEGILTE